MGLEEFRSIFLSYLLYQILAFVHSTGFSLSNPFVIKSKCKTYYMWEREYWEILFLFISGDIVHVGIWYPQLCLTESRRKNKRAKKNLL